jgi:molybdopterin converting factor subunit 1
MKIKIKAFGITKDILGNREVQLDIPEQTVAELRQHLIKTYPTLSGLKSILVAVNNAYADDDVLLKETDEVALIPPVSGG